jgi:UDPglucose 6-dehydrogenase
MPSSDDSRSHRSIAVVGTGYVGLVAAACLADNGHSVTCVDCNEAKILTLQAGAVPIYEPGLDVLVAKNRAAGRLKFTIDLTEAVQSSEVIFIAVGTPQAEDGSADLQHLLTAVDDVAHSMNGYKVIVIKSTVPVGTAARVRTLFERESGHPAGIVSNPEFLKQGSAVRDFLQPDRVVIGSNDRRAIEVMEEIYAPITDVTGAPLLVMDPASAELSKYTANAMLAVRISFMNEIANVCERVGADVDQVRKAVAADARIGPSFLFPGLGYGGSCFPKDVRALREFSAGRGYDFKILSAAEEVNRRQRNLFIEKIQGYFGSLKNRTIAIWGLAFKPNTDDMRDAPSITLMRRLLELGAQIHAHDPQAEPAARVMFGDRISLADHPYQTLVNADALVIATEWDQYRAIGAEFEQLRKLMRAPVVFDGRNLYDPQVMEQLGFVYFSVGREGRGRLVESGGRKCQLAT